jgi:DNA polymerase-3 subunit epsilon
MGRRTRFAPCALADMGRCQAPCDDRTTPERYGELVRELVDSLASPDGLLATLEARMSALAAQERFEEAALARDRLRAVAEALWRARVDRWLTSGRLVLRAPEAHRLALDRGALQVSGDLPAGPIGTPPARDRADELGALRGWVCRHRVTVESCEDPPAEPVAGGRELARILRQLREAGREPGRSSGRRAGTRG